MNVSSLPVRILISLCGVAMITFVAYRVVHVNETTAGFLYLLLVLIIASAWGFREAALASILAAVTFAYFFVPRIGAFTLTNAEEWVALFSFVTTAFVASQLSRMVER